MSRVAVAAIVLLGAAAPAELAAQATHQAWDPATAEWKPSGRGLESAVILGNPEAKGAYTIAFRLAPGAWIPPHTHPAAKQVTILSGELLMGFGQALDSTRASGLGAGRLMVVPPNTAHFEGARQRTVVLFSGEGPLVTNWITPPAR